MKQKTIKKEILITGIGLHTGNKVKIICKPAPENTGIQFVRVDLPEQPIIKACLENIVEKDGENRCNTLQKDGVKVLTTEHFMSVLSGLRITNLIVDIDAEELPGLDGSGIGYLKAIQEVGVEDQDADANVFKVKEAIGVWSGDSSLYIFPGEGCKISYTLDYDHYLLRSQFFDFSLDEETFVKQIVSSRTFCLESEVDVLQNQGFGKGANYDNTLVVGEDGVKNNELRFDNEFVRHKILDLIGDLYILGMPIEGHIFAVKSGHALNIALLKKIEAQKAKYLPSKAKEVSSSKASNDLDLPDGVELNIDAIRNILPHRYPFLFVDRVLSLDVGKKAIAIKNVTINDGFFQGHFPTKPVMPGVIMVEAMAQVAGIIMLSNPVHKGKVAFFMAVNNVKFRKIVSPGDQLVMDVQITKDKSRVAQARGISRVNNEVVAEADMTFSFADESFLYSK